MVVPKCVGCGSMVVEHVGKIPSAINFAGRILSEPLDGGSLFRCRTCGLVFRCPRMKKADLDVLYHLGSSENWQAAPSAREEWKIASQWISQYMPDECSILDVGCFDGGFLRSLPSSYKKFGIEIHEAARNKAQRNDINIVGTDFSSLIETDSVFDVVTAFDIIEHTHNPIEFLRDISSVVSKNGCIVISSGNSTALSWKLLGARYWYCTLSEHLSFISPIWCEWAASETGLVLKHVNHFSHSSVTWRKQISDAMKNLLYVATPLGFAMLRKMGLGGAEYREHKELLKYPPSWMSAKDHIVCMFVKR